MAKQEYVYWKDEDMWVGYLEEFPDYWTQAETEEDSKENFIDVYKELTAVQSRTFEGWLTLKYREKGRTGKKA